MPYISRYKKRLWELEKTDKAVAIIEKRGSISLEDLARELEVSNGTFITRINYHLKKRVFLVGGYRHWMYEPKTDTATFD